MTTSNLILKRVKVQNFIIELRTSQKGNPAVSLMKILQSGPNKGQLKYVEGFYFSSEKNRLQWIKDKVESINQYTQWKAEAKQRAEAVENPYQIGTILYDSWGYDQTNVDFYQVVEVTKKNVKVRKIGAELIETDTYDSGRVKPVKDSFTTEKAMLKRVRNYVTPSGIKFNVNGLSDYTAGDKGVYCSWGH